MSCVMVAMHPGSEEQTQADNTWIGAVHNVKKWRHEMIPKVREVLESGQFVRLPTRFEIHEWAIMGRFSLNRQVSRYQDRLATRGRAKSQPLAASSTIASGILRSSICSRPYTPLS
jgi:hypothetical protein